MVMVGYGENGYRLWNPTKNEIVTRRDVVFDESKLGLSNVFIESESSTDGVDEADSLTKDETPVDVGRVDARSTGVKADEIPVDVGRDDARSTGVNAVKSENDVQSTSINNESSAGTSRSKRVRQPPKRYGQFVDMKELKLQGDSEEDYFSAFALNATLNLAFGAVAYVDNVPQSFSEIAGREDAAHWMIAVADEMDSLKRNNTWTLVERPEDRSVVSCKWVFSRKRNEAGKLAAYKARLVARGFTPRQGLDFHETYSPVARIATLRLMLALAVERDLEIHQMDVKTAFLNGKLEEDIYMHQPDGFVKGEFVCKLNKSPYGLKQASRVWNERFHGFVLQNGFVRSEHDHCLYTRGNGKNMVYLLLYVDDLILLGEDINDIIKIKQLVSKEFEMRDMGETRNFLGINIERDRDRGILRIDQHSYLEDVLQRFGISDCKPARLQWNVN